MKTKLFFLILLASFCANAQIVNIPDAGFKTALIEAGTPSSIYSLVARNSTGAVIVIDTNNDNEIQVTEALAVYELNLYNGSGLIVCNSLEGIQAFTNLQKLYCSMNSVANLPLTGLVNLKDLRAAGNDFTSLNLNGLVNLEYLDIAYNSITTIDFSSLVNLKTLLCRSSGITNLNVSGLSNLVTLNAGSSSDSGNGPGGITSVNISGCTGLEELLMVRNSLTSIDVSTAVNLKKIEIFGNQLTSLDVSGLSHLENIYCFANNLSSLTFGGNLSLKTLECNQNQITSLDLSGAPSLEYLHAFINQITTIDISLCTALIIADLSNNNIQNLSLGSKPFLEEIHCNVNDLISIDLSGCSVLEVFSAWGNEFTNLDISTCTSLTAISLSSNQNLQELTLGSKPFLTYVDLGFCNLSEIDFSGCPVLTSPQLIDNFNLAYINAKNGPVLLLPQLDLMDDEEWTSWPMIYMCVDEGEESAYSNLFSQYSYVNFNSYCSFTPGANYNTITGTLTFDLDNNGCSPTDVLNDFFKVKIQSGTATGATFTNSLSQYKFFTQAGNFAITPEFENNWFTATPATATINFANNNNNISTNNFCITSVGSHPDVEVVVYPIGNAQPGFDAQYKVVYKNKGNQALSGAVTFNYDDAVLDFVSATPAESAAVTGQLTFNYTNLLPFEDRSAIITLNLNGPMETPALNLGDELDFSVAITPTAGDETPGDNTFSITQEIVGSYDPNDITCLEGDIVSPAEIGDYLHYVVNFENTGTAPTSFIVVKVDVNPAQYDIASLRVMNTSHASDIRVTGNRIEFMMPTAALAAGDHGNILFKMKTKDNLIEGNMVKKKASIYFDYNFPIVTDDANTTFQALSTGSWTKDDSVKVYPNPSAGIVKIEASSIIKSIELYDVQGRLLEVQKSGDVNTSIDIATRAKGIYFAKVITGRGVKVEKIIRE